MSILAVLFSFTMIFMRFGLGLEVEAVVEVGSLFLSIVIISSYGRICSGNRFGLVLIRFLYGLWRVFIFQLEYF